MPSPSTVIAAILLLFVALVTGAIYVLGIPKDVKRSLERKTLETMGENQASDLVKDAIHQIPEDDRLQNNELSNRVGELTGNIWQSSLGDIAGGTTD